VGIKKEGPAKRVNEKRNKECGGERAGSKGELTEKVLLE